LYVRGVLLISRDRRPSHRRRAAYRDDGRCRPVWRRTRRGYL